MIMLKVFVYSKRTSKKVALISNVLMITTDDKAGVINIYTDTDEIMTFDQRTFKTTIYQN